MALIALAACTSPAERAEQQEQREISECTKLGFQPDTAQFNDCRLQVRASGEQRKADRLSASENIRQFQSNHPGAYLPAGSCVTC